MTHRTRPAHLSLKLGLAALALLVAAPHAPRLHAQTDVPPPVPPLMPPVATMPSGDALTKEWLLYPLRARRHSEAELVRLVQSRSVSFQPTAEDEKELREAGATDRLLDAVRNKYRRPMTLGIGGGTSAGVGSGPGPGAQSGGSMGPGEGTGLGPGRGKAEDAPLFRENQVTRRAVITFRPEPGYTEEARRNHVEGLVRVRAVLRVSGEVTDVAVYKRLPDGLTEKAVAATRQIRFTPAEKDGRKVSQFTVLEYNFFVPLDESDVDERAIILEKPEAGYTEEARRNDVGGKVVLKVTLTSYGRVVVDSVEAGLPHGLTEKAVEAAGRIKFKPALLKGRAVSQLATLEYVFTP